jgi:hypothetical protein
MNGIWIGVWLLVLSNGGLAYQNAQSDSPESKSTIEGQVLNLNTGTPIRKAVVQLTGSLARSGAPRIELARETDSEGHFAFTGLESGRYDLTAWREGFMKRPFGPNPNAASPILLATSERRNDIVLRLPPMSVVTGRVLDEGGEPVMALEVIALRLQYRRGKREWTRASSGTTSDLGEYRISKLGPGRYLVTTSPRDSALVTWNKTLKQPLPETPETIYPGTYYPGVMDESAAIPVSVGTGVEVRGIDISLAPVRTFRIRGSIVKPAGVAYAVVAWERKGGGPKQIALHLPASENGFELRGMVPGPYIVYAEPEDSDVRALARQAVVVTDRHVDGVVMNMVPATEIHGQVRIEDAATRPDLSKLSVELRTSAIYFVEPAPVAESLSFVLKDVVSAQFEVGLGGVPDSCFVKSIRYGSEEIGDTGSEFVNGATMEITLSGTAGQIDGSVADSGHRVAGATVVLKPKGVSAFSVTTADHAGAFRFGGLRPGEYRVLAVDGTEPGTYPDPDLIELLEGKAESVSLAAKGRQTVHLELIAVGAIQEQSPVR